MNISNPPDVGAGVGAHTVGPWRIEHKPGDSTGALKIVGATGAVVALLKAAGDRKVANARLIAKAPDMVDALRQILPMLEEFENDHLVGDEGCLWPVENVRWLLSDIDEKACASCFKPGCSGECLG